MHAVFGKKNVEFLCNIFLATATTGIQNQIENCVMCGDYVSFVQTIAPMLFRFLSGMQL